MGTYRPKGHSLTRLQLRGDHTFEFALLDPQKDSLLFPKARGQNFYTRGTWQLEGRKKLALKVDPSITPASTDVQDSITRFTKISSFNFWNRYGDPVPIRYLLIPPSRPKPHFGNSLFFFAQDFNPKDTLQFYFEGYKPVKYPGTIARSIGNNMHNITLVESLKSDVFSKVSFEASARKLRARKTSFTLIKMN